MSYNYVDKSNEINNSYNFIRKEENKIIQQGEQQIKRTSKFLINANFDIEEGFKSNGIYSFSIINPKNGNEFINIKSSNFKKDGFQYSFNGKSNKASISFDSEDNSFMTDWLLKNGVSQEKSYREISSSYLQDLDFLYEEYLFPNLKRIFETEDDFTLLSAIKNKRIEDELCFFISDMVDIYNQSYIKNKSEITKDYNSTDYNQAHHRFSICTQDDEFKENIENRISLFKNSINSKTLSNVNVRGDKNISFLDNIKKYEESLSNISNELTYRSKMNIRVKNMSDSSYKSSVSKDCIKVCKDYENNRLITLDEKNKISNFEEKIFKGTITKDEQEEYKRITSDIQSRYKEYLRNFKLQSDFLSRAGFTEIEARNHRIIDKTYGISNLKNFIVNLENNFEEFKFQQSNELDAQLVLSQNKNLEEEISKHGEFNEETGEILLDTEKKAVIEKIKSLDKLQTSQLKESQINTLLENDIPSLSNIVFKTETLCGLKDFYLNGIQEEDRQALFGEHYHYLSADKFFEILDKKIDEYEKSKNEHIDTVLLADTIKKQLMEGAQGSPFKKEFKEIISYLETIDPSKLESYLPTSDNDSYNKESIQKLINDAIKSPELKEKAETDQFKSFLKDIMIRSSSEYEDIKSKNITNNESKIVNDRFLSKIEDSLTHKVGNIKVLKHDVESQLGINPKEVLTDDEKKLDIKKILTLRNSLLDEKICGISMRDWKAMTDNERKDINLSVEDNIKISEQARKIIYLEENLLNYKVERDPETLAVSNKDLKAFSALKKGDIIKKYFEDEKEKFEKAFKNDNDGKSIEDLKNELIDKKTKLSKLEDEKESGKRFMSKQRDKKIDSLQKEIKELEEKIDKYYLSEKEVYSKVIERLEKEVAIPLSESLENNKNLEQAQKEGQIAKIELLSAVENLKNIIEETNSNYISTNGDKKINIALNKDDSDKKLLIVLAAIKEHESSDIIERIKSNEKTDGNFLLKVVNSEFSQFSEKDKEDLIEAIKVVYDKTYELKAEKYISPDGIRIGIDEIIKKEYSMIPLDINGSNDLFNALTNGEVPYNVVIKNNTDKKAKKEDIVISNKKERLFEYYLQNDCSLDPLNEAIRNEIELNFYKGKNNITDEEIETKINIIEQEFNDIMKELKPKGDKKLNIQVCPEITEESKKALIDNINAYGDTKNVLIVPPFDRMKLSKTCMVSIDSSNGDNSSLNVIFNNIIDTSNLNSSIREGVKSFENQGQKDKTQDEVKRDSEIILGEKVISTPVELKNALIKFSKDNDNLELKENIINYLSNENNKHFITPEDFPKHIREESQQKEILTALHEVLEEVKENEQIKKITEDISKIEETLKINSEKEKVESKESEETIEKSKVLTKIKDSILEGASNIGYKHFIDDALYDLKLTIEENNLSKNESEKIKEKIDEIKSSEVSNKDKHKELIKLQSKIEEFSSLEGKEREKRFNEFFNNEQNYSKEDNGFEKN